MRMLPCCWGGRGRAEVWRSFRAAGISAAVPTASPTDRRTNFGGTRRELKRASGTKTLDSRGRQGPEQSQVFQGVATKSARKMRLRRIGTRVKYEDLEDYKGQTERRDKQIEKRDWNKGRALEAETTMGISKGANKIK